MTRAVVQGFGPFGEHKENPSALLAQDLAASPPAGLEVIPVVLPTSRAQVSQRLPAVLEDLRPDIFLGVGLAAGRCAVAAEKIAVNVADYPLDDADGFRPAESAIHDAGPAAYLATLPVHDIAAAWQHAGIPGYVSVTAGTYLCNESFYRASAAVARLGLPTLVGFVHVPLLPHQVRQPKSEPSMCYDLQRQALVSALACASAAVRPSAPEAAGPAGTVRQAGTAI